LSEPESLGEIMGGRGLKSLRGKRQKLELLKIHWAGIAGEREAQHSSPTKLSRRVLVVAAEGPSWAAELSMKTAALLKGIEKVIGSSDVQKIKIQARSAGARTEGTAEGLAGQGEGPVRRDGVHLGMEVQEELDSISEEETKNALARMLEASVSSKQYKPDED
jgi:predicted nucleic acid-binding Zn ribbon protein